MRFPDWCKLLPVVKYAAEPQPNPVQSSYGAPANAPYRKIETGGDTRYRQYNQLHQLLLMPGKSVQPYKVPYDAPPPQPAGLPDTLQRPPVNRETTPFRYPFVKGLPPGASRFRPIEKLPSPRLKDRALMQET